MRHLNTMQLQAATEESQPKKPIESSDWLTPEELENLKEDFLKTMDYLEDKITL